MTIITVTAPVGKFDLSHRRTLAQTLTDAVLVPEVGQLAVAARAGFQVRFQELETSAMAIGGVLLEDSQVDALSVDVTVMDAAWPDAVRAQVIANIFEALCAALGEPRPSPAWWVTFRVIDEGSWGSRGGVLSVLDLLKSGVFTPERTAAIRSEIEGRSPRGAQ